MSEIRTAEDVRQYLAELDRTQPLGDPHELREREFERRKREAVKERERQERAARKAEEKQQHAVANNWDAWHAAIDARIEQHFFSGDLGVGGAFKNAVGEALGKKAAQVRKELRDEFNRADEELRRAFEVQLAEQRERSSQTAWVSWVDDRIKATFGYGRDVLLAEVKSVIEEAQRLLEAKFVALEERVKAGLPSKFPIAKVYRSDSVHYSGDLVTHAGATYQATCDTCREPPHDDWVRIARAGCDGLTPNFCGLYDAYRKYQQFDVVEFDGSSFIAVRDLDPGTIPGEDGWQILCRLGSRGPVGEVGPRGRKGERGARGEDAPTIVSWTIDRTHYRAIPTLSNGTQGAVLELRGLFEQFVVEVGYMAGT